MLWKGCYVLEYDHIALLASAGLYGFHCKAKYEWHKDGTAIEGENTHSTTATSMEVYPDLLLPVDKKKQHTLLS